MVLDEAVIRDEPEHAVYEDDDAETRARKQHHGEAYVPGDFHDLSSGMRRCAGAEKTDAQILKEGLRDVRDTFDALFVGSPPANMVEHAMQLYTMQFQEQYLQKMETRLANLRPGEPAPAPLMTGRPTGVLKTTRRGRAGIQKPPQRQRYSRCRTFVVAAVWEALRHFGHYGKFSVVQISNCTRGLLVSEHSLHQATKDLYNIQQARIAAGNAAVPSLMPEYDVPTAPALEETTKTTTTMTTTTMLVPDTLAWIVG
jgi:hypothetical protein